MKSLVGYVDDEEDRIEVDDNNGKKERISSLAEDKRRDTQPKSIKVQVMTSIRKPNVPRTSIMTPSGSGSESISSSKDRVNVSSATRLMQGASLDRDRPRLSSKSSMRTEMESGGVKDDETEEIAIRQAIFPAPIRGLENWGIPPATNEPCSSSLQAKLDQFRSLKEQGKHFNASLMSNKSFRNPHLYAKLVEFVDVDESVTNFPKDMWDPHVVQVDWFADSIADAQKEMYERSQAAQASGKRSKIDFTSSSGSKPRQSEYDHGHDHSRDRNRNNDQGRERDQEQAWDRDNGRERHGESRSKDRPKDYRESKEDDRYHPYSHEGHDSLGSRRRRHSENSSRRDR